MSLGSRFQFGIIYKPADEGFLKYLKGSSQGHQVSYHLLKSKTGYDAQV